MKELHPEELNKLKVFATSQNLISASKSYLMLSSFFLAKNFNLIRRRKRWEFSDRLSSTPSSTILHVTTKLWNHCRVTLFLSVEC